MDSLVYVADLETFQLSQAFIDRLPPPERTRISRLRRESDRKRSLLGLRLLEKAMNDAGHQWRWEWFTRDAAGRPGAGHGFAETAYDFNISHSGDVVVCAIGPGRLGIDVEKITPVEMDDFKSIIPEPARMSILASPRPEAEFFCWWTRIESVIKGIGCGFAVDTHSIDFSPQTAVFGKQRWHYHDLDLVPGYACCLALAA